MASPRLLVEKVCADCSRTYATRSRNNYCPRCHNQLLLRSNYTAARVRRLTPSQAARIPGLGAGTYRELRQAVHREWPPLLFTD